MSDLGQRFQAVMQRQYYENLMNPAKQTEESKTEQSPETTDSEQPENAKPEQKEEAKTTEKADESQSAQKPKETKAEKAFKRAEDYLEKKKPEYDQARNHLLPVERENCCLIDSNICTFSTNDQKVGPICEVCFDPTVPTEICKESYYTIKNYLRKEYKHRNKPEPMPINYMPFAQNHGSVESFQDQAIRFLYEITAGDAKALVAFAELCVFITTRPLVLNRPIVILADRSLHQPLLDFFWYLGHGQLPNFGLNNYLKTIDLRTIYVAGLNGVLANLNIEGEIPLTDASVSKIKTILSGKTISINNPLFDGKTSDKLYIKNRIPFIYITQSHEKYIHMTHAYNAFPIQLAGKGDFRFDPITLPWFIDRFIELGRIWNLGKTQPPLTVPKITDDDIFSAFVQDLCVLNPDAVCPKADLYEAYCKYYALHYARSPLSRVTFGKRFALFGGFETVRPHSSRGAYPRCFKGVEIDQEKYDEAFSGGETVKYQSTFDEFRNGINAQIEMMFRKAPDFTVHTNK